MSRDVGSGSWLGDSTACTLITSAIVSSYINIQQTEGLGVRASVLNIQHFGEILSDLVENDSKVTYYFHMLGATCVKMSWQWLNSTLSCPQILPKLTSSKYRVQLIFVDYDKENFIVFESLKRDEIKTIETCKLKVQTKQWVIRQKIEHIIFIMTNWLDKVSI